MLPQQTWEITAGSYVASLNIGMSISSLACSPILPMAVCGTANGFLYILDFAKFDKPRIILRERMHKGPVNGISFDQTGSVFATCSTDGHVFVFSGFASHSFKVLGYAIVPNGAMNDVSAYYNADTDKIRVAAPILDYATSGKHDGTSSGATSGKNDGDTFGAFSGRKNGATDNSAVTQAARKVIAFLK